jgi:hypothetical protein
LRAVPDERATSAGTLKIDALRFLAPSALTITAGDQWARLRAFNEAVLTPGRPHPFAQTFLTQVRRAFDLPVQRDDDVRDAMGRAMVAITLGRSIPDADPAEDAHVLFDVVQQPVRRRLLGWFHARRRERLYATIRQRWDETSPHEETLLSLAKRNAAGNEASAIIEQLPHWMFTFTGSGTDLLVRMLALVSSRPAVRARVLDEASRAGPLDVAASMFRLPFLDACLKEAGRLFPPVARTFHRERTVGGTAEFLHFFPLLHRDDALGAAVHDFDPDRWRAAPDAAARASNLFLRGPRVCPGQDLILFVCRAAATRILIEQSSWCPMARLASDPLPISFPRRSVTFSVTERA